MPKNCTICKKEGINDSYCEMCSLIMGALYKEYTIQQIMAIFSHIIGSKITREITDNMYQTLKDSYDAEKLKKEDMLN